MSTETKVSAGAESSSPLTLDDILALSTLSQVAIAPDGSMAAYVLRAASAAEEHPRGRICLVRLDEQEVQVPRPFTGGSGLDSAPRFSPDGRSLAFLSDRAQHGTAQLYALPLAGGEAARLTDERGGVADPQWSPDGTLLAYLVTAAESEETTQRKQERDDALVVGEIKKRRRLWVCASDGSGSRPLTPEDRHVSLYAWAPGGARIAAVTAASPEFNEHFGAARLVLYPLQAGQEPRDLGQIDTPSDIVWSRDGATIATRNGSVAEFPQTWLTFWPADGGAPRQALRDLPATALWLGRPAAADHFLLLAWQETHTPIYRVDLDGRLSGPIADAVPDRGSVLEKEFGAGPGLAVSASGNRIAMVRTAGDQADDLWLWEEGKGLRRLTDANPWLPQCTLGRQQEIRWPSFDGQEIGGLLITPPGYHEGQRYPLVVNVHGGPTWLWTDHLHANWHDWGQWLAAAGFVVLLPNPRGSAGRGNEFAHANICDLGGGDYRDVMAGVDYLIAQGLVDESRMGIGGWSYGGTLTPWTLTQTTRFKAAVMGAGICNWISFAGVSDIRIFADRLFEADLHKDATPLWERSALRLVSHVTTPTLIVHGEKDVRVPVNQAYEFYSALRHMGVPAELVVYPREGHAFVERHHQRDLLQRIRAWFVRYLLDGE